MYLLNPVGTTFWLRGLSLTTLRISEYIWSEVVVSFFPMTVNSSASE